MKLSILIPVYNERYLVEELVHRVLSVALPADMSRQLVIVDDESSDGSREIIERLAQAHPSEITYIPHEKNTGKGGAIRTAISHASGEFCIFQDADLEYDPSDYPKLLAPLLAGSADVVLGSRYLPAEYRRVLYYWHSRGNYFLTMLSNIFTNLDLTDMETCYKAFRTEVLKTIPIRSNGFGIEPEITAKVAKRGLRVYEVPISYNGRTYAEGKKITWIDGFVALYTTLKYRLIDDVYDERTGKKMLASMARTHRLNRWLSETLRPFLGHRVLEIGSGLGTASLTFLPRDRYVATDQDELYLSVLRSLALGRPRLEVARLNANQKEDFKEFHGAVDTVLAINVLEHLPDPTRALQNFYDVLDAHGALVLVVPQGNWLYCPIDEGMEHSKRFDQNEIEEALAKAGFEVEKTIQFNKIGLPMWFFLGVILRRQFISPLLLKMFDASIWFWKRINGLLPWKGLSLAVVARKKGDGGDKVAG